MELTHFSLNTLLALAMGLLIGIERQFRQHPAGLRTNALVCVGAALFISLTRTADDHVNPSYIVSGIGFLAGGVILREGLTVKGMNTAATLWCTAAVGSLSGSGHREEALIATAVVLGVHLTMRPLSHWIDARMKHAVGVETTYRLRIVCDVVEETLVRSIVLRHIASQARMSVQGISTQDGSEPGRAIVEAEIFSLDRNERAMQDVMSRLNIEPAVKSVSWTRG